MLRQGRTIDAIEYLEHSLVMRTKMYGTPSMEVDRAGRSLVTSCNTGAMMALQASSFPLCSELLRKADALTRNSKLIPNKQRRLRLRAVTLNNLACFYRRRKKLHSALRQLEEALGLELMCEEGVQGPAGTHLNICAVLGELGQHEAALMHAKSALDLLLVEFREWNENNANSHRPDGFIDGHHSPYGSDGMQAVTPGPGLLLPPPRVDTRWSGLSMLAAASHNAGVQLQVLGDLEGAVKAYARAARLARDEWGAQHAKTLAMSRSLQEASAKLTANVKRMKLPPIGSSASIGAFDGTESRPSKTVRRESSQKVSEDTGRIRRRGSEPQPGIAGESTGTISIFNQPPPASADPDPFGPLMDSDADGSRARTTATTPLPEEEDGRGGLLVFEEKVSADFSPKSKGPKTPREVGFPLRRPRKRNGGEDENDGTLPKIRDKTNVSLLINQQQRQELHKLQGAAELYRKREMLGRIAAVEEQLSYVERVVGGEEEADRQDQEEEAMQMVRCKLLNGEERRMILLPWITTHEKLMELAKEELELNIAFNLYHRNRDGELGELMEDAAVRAAIEDGGPRSVLQVVVVTALDKEREEAEEAMRRAEKERLEMEEADLIMEKERSEAVAAAAEAERAMEEAEMALERSKKEEEEAEEAEREVDRLKEHVYSAQKREEELRHKAAAAKTALEKAIAGRCSAAERETLEQRLAAAEKQVEEAEAVVEGAMEEQAEAEEVAFKERAEADDARAHAESEREEAEAAQREAKREQEEYEAAKEVAQREREEFEQAQREADKEMAEYQEVRMVVERTMSHPLEEAQRRVEEDSATKIVAAFHGFKVRKDVKSRHLQLNMLREEESCTVIVTNAKMYLARRFVANCRVSLKAERELKATKTLQRVYRGHEVRKQFAMRKVHVEQEKREVAAARVQAVVRGHGGRQEARKHELLDILQGIFVERFLFEEVEVPELETGGVYGGGQEAAGGKEARQMRVAQMKQEHAKVVAREDVIEAVDMVLPKAHANRYVQIRLQRDLYRHLRERSLHRILAGPQGEVECVAPLLEYHSQVAIADTGAVDCLVLPRPTCTLDEWLYELRNGWKQPTPDEAIRGDGLLDDEEPDSPSGDPEPPKLPRAKSFKITVEHNSVPDIIGAALGPGEPGGRISGKDLISQLIGMVGCLHLMHEKKVVVLRLLPETWGLYGKRWLATDLSYAQKEGELLDPKLPDTRTLALPEVLAAERDGKLDQLAATLAMDVFSLGLLLHKALIGKDLFDGMSPKEVRAELLREGELKLDLSGLREHIGRYVLVNTLRKNPHDRFTVKDVLLNLAQMKGKWTAGRRRGHPEPVSDRKSVV